MAAYKRALPYYPERTNNKLQTNLKRRTDEKVYDLNANQPDCADGILTV